MFGSVTAFFTALAEGFKTTSVIKERQSESTVIKQLKRRLKAVDYAEKIIFLVDELEAISTDKEYQKLRKQFFKYN